MANELAIRVPKGIRLPHSQNNLAVTALNLVTQVLTGAQGYLDSIPKTYTTQTPTLAKDRLSNVLTFNGMEQSVDLEISRRTPASNLDLHLAENGQDLGAHMTLCNPLGSVTHINFQPSSRQVSDKDVNDGVAALVQFSDLHTNRTDQSASTSPVLSLSAKPSIDAPDLVNMRVHLGNQRITVDHIVVRETPHSALAVDHFSFPTTPDLTETANRVETLTVKILKALF